MKSLIDLQVGDELIQSDWTEVSQNAVNQFADATGDHQWIHIDVARCEKESPFGTTIAHGFMTASMLPQAFSSVLGSSDKIASVINYGIDSLRFLEPVRVGSHIRFMFTVKDRTSKPSGTLFHVSATCAIKDSDKPALVGTFLMLAVEKSTT